MKKKFIKVTAIVAVVAAFGLNMEYTLDGYGIKSGKLHHEVLAATTTTTGTGTGAYKKDTSSCTYSGTTCAWCYVTIGSVTFQADAQGKWSYSSNQSHVMCSMNGDELCTSTNCPTTP